MKALDEGKVKTRSKISMGTNLHYEGRCPDTSFSPICVKGGEVWVQQPQIQETKITKIVKSI